MKLLIALFVFLVSATLSVEAQGFRGNVTLSGNVIAVTGHCVDLMWSASPNAATFNIYRGTTHGGPYLRIASGILTTTYTDVEITDAQTLYYVTTQVNGGIESGYSNETVAAIP